MSTEEYGLALARIIRISAATLLFGGLGSMFLLTSTVLEASIYTGLKIGAGIINVATLLFELIGAEKGVPWWWRAPTWIISILSVLVAGWAEHYYRYDPIP